MQENGAHKNLIKLIYKVYIYTYFMIIFVSIINVIFDIVLGKKIIFFPSIYLLVMPAFKFIQTSSYFEFIPFVIFLGITGIVWYKCKNEFFSSPIKSPKFIFINIFWYLISTDFFIVVSHLDNTEDLNADNMIFCLVYLIFQIIVMYFNLIDYAKLIDEQNKHKKLSKNQKRIEILKKRYSSISNAIALPLVCTLSAFVGCYVFLYSGFISIAFYTAVYVILGICAVYFTIDNLYQFNKFVKSKVIAIYEQSFRRKLIVCSISNLFIYAVSYVIIYILC